MGFNNAGLANAVEALKRNRRKIIIGGNIGKNTQTNPDGYTKDYLECFNELHAHVDYFVLNVSCPNVGSHAKLEDVNYLRELITEVQGVNKFKSEERVGATEFNTNLSKVANRKVNNIAKPIVPLNKEDLKTNDRRLSDIGNGGISGQSINKMSTRVIKYLAEKSNKAFPIIGVGGIHSEQDALDKIDAGADLVQIYTGFIYEGPSLIKRINRAILSRK